MYDHISGVFGKRIRKTYTRITDEVKNEIIAFYLDDTNSRALSGIRQVRMQKVPGKQSIPIPKKLLLYDLKELYTKWITETNKSQVPSFSFFACLKPMNCVSAGEPGTHIICVCSEHQNVKLKLAAVIPLMNYREVLEEGVCSKDNRDCMLHYCKNCPKTDGIRIFLESNIDLNVKNVYYNNWVIEKTESKDSDSSFSSKTSLKSFEIPLNFFIEDLSKSVWNFTKHHFISEKQKDYLKFSKNTLESNTGLLISDFAENYAFVAQDSAQAWYFNNTTASLFTVSFYYKEGNELKTQSFCVISASTKHQAYSVHIFYEKVLEEIKKMFPFMKIIINFSDGAPTQYKNKNHLINVCYHEEDFGIKLKSYNFFATSHGKSTCDSIGAVAKNYARRAALHGEKITDAEEMYNYLNENVSEIRFLWVSENDVIARGKKLQKRFTSAITIHGTRQYHCFEPIDECTLKAKLYSFDSISNTVKIQ